MPVGGRAADEAGFVADESENDVKDGEKESGFDRPAKAARYEVAGEDCREYHKETGDMGKGGETDGVECG